jgi:hypothetical protein
MRITTIAALALTGLMTGNGSAAEPDAGQQPHSVIELFTSQGCSSCPPADKLLAQYADREDVLTLSFNVDVWDWIGWKDTLASPDHTRRQRGYALAMGESNIYTPQVVVDGRSHAVGSNQAAINLAVEQSGDLTVPIHLVDSDNSITVDIGAAAHGNMPYGTLWLVMYDREVTVEIERGENTGRTLTYTNVVRKLRPVAMWKGQAISLDIPKSEITHANVDGCAFLLQEETAAGLPGPMLGAARIAGW